MFNRNPLVPALLVAGMIGVAVTPRPSAAAVDVWVNIGPPPERVEVAPAPRPGYAYQTHRWVERDARSHNPNRS